jgi:sortase (surface protein transpeptidase)
MARQGLAIKQKRNFHWIAVILWLLLFAILICLGWFGYRYFTTGELPPVLSVGALAANRDVDETPITENEISNYTTPADEPRYITFPTIDDTKARVLKTGIDDNNQLAFPDNIHDAGWYEKSAKPGQGYGVALLTGHNKGVDSSGVFAKISTLQPGDQVIIERGDGKTTTYLVKDTQTMSVEEASATGMKTMLEPIEGASEGLTLVTTSGNWVPRIKQFEQRTIVRAANAQ